MKTTKILLPIFVLIASAIAIFFLAPLAAWKEKQLSYAAGNINYIKAPTPSNETYLLFCKTWWCNKFSNITTLIIKDKHQSEYKGTTGVKELDDLNKDVLKDILS